MPRTVDMKSRNEFLSAVTKVYGDSKKTISRKEIVHVCNKHRKLSFPLWLTNNPALRVERGAYLLDPSAAMSKDTSPAVIKSIPRGIKRAKTVEVPSVPTMVETPPVNLENNQSTAILPVTEQPTVNYVSLIPSKYDGYVPFGLYDDLEAIIESGVFYPTYITGHSGNGKTMMVEQVCAKLKREMVRANITEETDEDDLIGGFRLINGNTIYQDGPVVMAMERGAVLLLDEVDLGGNRLLCLQPVLEGKAIYIKKINRLVTPAAGFTIVATANTKGQGSIDGKYIGTKIQNEAFLERFSATMEQEYPSLNTEKKILDKLLKSHNLENPEFTENLARWADVTRKAYAEQSSTEFITTRRLTHIVNSFSIFKDRRKAIKLCLARFDEENKEVLFDLYAAIDETIKWSDEENEERIAKAKEEAELATKVAEQRRKDIEAGIASGGPQWPMSNASSINPAQNTAQAATNPAASGGVDTSKMSLEEFIEYKTR